MVKRGRSKILALALLGVSAFSPMAAIVAKSGKTEAVAETSSVSYMRKAENVRALRAYEADGFNVNVLESWRAEETALAAERQSVRSYLEQVAGYEGLSLDGAQYTYNDLYYENNARAGYVVDFSKEGKDGYAIFFINGGEPTLAEINFDAHSPYIGKSGKYLYPSFGTYAVKDDNGVITEVGNSFNVKPYSMTLNSDEKVNVQETITINYNKGAYIESPKDSSIEYFMNYKYNTGLSNKNNNCANAAGVIALNYWNKYYNNKLLKLKYEERDLGSYDMIDDVATKYMDIFYDYMWTNKWLALLSTMGGSLPGNIYSGFERLIKEKGFGVERNLVETYGEMKHYIDKDIPIFIVSTDYYFTPENRSLPRVYNNSGNHSFTIDYYHAWGLFNAHTFIGYGYAECDFTDSNGKTNSVKFIKVADGWGYYSYFNLSSSNVFSAAAIDVIKLSGC